MRTYKCYLSGPITGLTANEAISWTDYAKEKLSTRFVKDNVDDAMYEEYTGIYGYRPLRGKKDYLENMGKLSALGYESNPMSTQKGIVTRDYYDVRSSDLILINLLGAKRISIGTMKEQAAAYILNKPTVLVMEKQGNVHEHCFVLEECGWIYHDLDTAIEAVKTILLDD